MPSSRLSLIIAVALAQTVIHAPIASAGDLTPAEVRQSIEAGVRFIKGRQNPNGSWPDITQLGGVTALATLALINAQVPVNDPAIQRALRTLQDVPNQFTYTVALKIAVFAAADPKGYRREIQEAADWLVRGQMKGGSWGYGNLDPRRALGGQGDNSNTQYALLGLHEAAQAGARIPKIVWNRAQQHWTGTQSAAGGWSYVGRGKSATGSMTAAGVASLIICGNQVNESLEDGYGANGAAKRCGQYRQHPAIAKGLKWLGKNFSAKRNPNASSWHHYWLYGVERAGILAGLKYFGPHDWYREGAEHLINSQGGGFFGGGGAWSRSVVDTSFALLFLSKGRRPLLMNKLKWSDDTRWNPDRHDCRNLVAYLGDRLGEPVSWQVMGLDAPVEEWLQAPILYLQGHQFPKLRKTERQKIRRFITGGGTLFAEACCSKKRFRKGFEQLVGQLFPENPLRELGPDHPIWSALHDLKPGRWPLFGLESGCRTSVIFSPRDLSCLWEQADVPKLSEEAFKLGSNIAAYATGREPLRDKLSVVRLPPGHTIEDDDGPVRGALQFAQISHSGDWKPDPLALPRLAEMLRKNANVTVVARPAYLAPDDPKLLDHPVAFMTGHFAFEMNQKERKALRRYLERGGFLFAEACCGRRAFTDSFENLMRRMFPDSRMHAIGPGHAIRNSPFGYKIEDVQYRPALSRERPDLAEPVLVGLDINGRTAVVFSRWGISCGLEDHKCYTCRGLVPDDARRIAVNIVLYALMY